ncbi:hypothetical protein KKA14_16850, partial [bacterium]|nr:hypothetical protein [bacterium]
VNVPLSLFFVHIPICLKWLDNNQIFIFFWYGGANELRKLNFSRDYPGECGIWWELDRTRLSPGAFINATFTVLYPDFIRTFMILLPLVNLCLLGQKGPFF